MKTTEIKRGQFNPYYPVSDLKHSLVNRDIVQNHSDIFKKKLQQFGWLSPIIIDTKGNKLGDMGIFMECRFENKKLTKTKPNLKEN